MKAKQCEEDDATSRACVNISHKKDETHYEIVRKLAARFAINPANSRLLPARKNEERSVKNALVILCAVPLLAHAEIMSFLSGETCGSYIQAAGPQRELYLGHILGYITAMNTVRERSSPVEVSGYRTWLEEYCKKSPFNNLHTAAVVLDHDLGPGLIPYPMEAKSIKRKK